MFFSKAPKAIYWGKEKSKNAAGKTGFHMNNNNNKKLTLSSHSTQNLLKCIADLKIKANCKTVINKIDTKGMIMKENL